MLLSKLGGGVGSFGLEDVKVHGWIAFLYATDKVECFGEVVEGVEEDERWLLTGEMGEHVNCDETSEAEGGGLKEVWEGNEAPFENF
jgi:hypothetical protein